MARKSIHQTNTERPYYDANQKFNAQVNENINEIVAHSAKKANIDL
jgi:hypothetical protein